VSRRAGQRSRSRRAAPNPHRRVREPLGRVRPLDAARPALRDEDGAVTGLWLALVLCAGVPPSATLAGAAGGATAAADGYEAIVAQGVDEARAGRPDAADRAFARAIACEPSRPEAYVERGGLRFLEKRYDEAVRDLEAALLRGDDAYARELLASSLYLSGRTDEALARW